MYSGNGLLCDAYSDSSSFEPISTNLANHIIYEEPDTPSLMNASGYMLDNNSGSGIMSSEPCGDEYRLDETHNQAERADIESKFYPNDQHLHGNNSQQQQIWIPRDETSIGQVHSPNAVVMDAFGNQTGLTLCNGKELPADLQNMNPAFTIRRHIIQIQEEHKQIETLKRTIESKLKIQLPSAANVEEIGIALSDGVILCHLMNQIFPRAVQIIHVPSLAMVC